MKTIILLPTYNEANNIGVIIPQIFEALPDVQVMVVDDNSPDGTAEVVKTLQTTYSNLSLHQRPGKEGLGKAYLDAFQKVLIDPSIEAVWTMDADLSHNPKYLPEMLAAMANHDFVIGSRYIIGGSVVGWEKWRQFLSWGGNHYCRLVTRLPIRDCTTGYGCIRATTLRQIDFSDFDASGYAFLMYLKYKIWQQGARILEIPICFTNRISGESKISSSIIHEGILLPWKLIKKQSGKKISTDCIICKKSTGVWWFSKNGHDLYRCSECALIFVSPIPTSTAAVYSENYFCGANEGFGYVNYDEDKQADLSAFTKYLHVIEANKPNRGTLLDIGAATGSFVAEAKKSGWIASGLEISEYAAAAGRKKGLAIKTGTVDSTDFSPESFDVITLWDVFEHFPNPRTALTKINTWLKPGGLLVMNLPDAGSWYAHTMGKHWQLIIPPEHLHLFNTHNLTKLLNEYTFTVVATDKIGKKFKPAYILQILYTIQHQRIWKFLSEKIRKTPLNKLSIPINLRDNMFIVSKKQ